ncbi:MAG: FAD-dependent oxidoreductase [Solirubrobacteraceae bacterium]
MTEHFDAVVIGAGPGGEVAVSKLQAQGLSVALVERELIGGECAYWACIPRRPLLRAPECGARRAARPVPPSPQCNGASSPAAATR